MISASNDDRSDFGSFLSQGIATGAIGLVQVSLAVSLAALIFTGDLQQALPLAAGSSILGGSIVSAIVGWKSGFRGAMAGPQDTGAVVLATVVGPATASLAGQAQLVTALVMVAISTLLIALAFFALGHFGLGSVVRFIPQPVVGGFVGGTGWLMTWGGIEVMANQKIRVSSDFLSAATAAFVASGLALSLFITFAIVRNLPPLSISVSIFCSGLLFFLVVFATSSIAAVEASGWLLGPFADGSGWSPLGPDDLGRVDWGVILGQAPAFAAITLLSAVALLLNLTTVEVVVDQDLDLDHELRVAGLANIAVGLTGGIAGYHKISDTLLAQKMGVRTRAVPIAVGALGVIVLLTSGTIIGLVPRPIAGGVVAGLGLSLLWTWLADYIIGGSRTNQILGICIVGAIALFGPLEGVAVGVAIAAGLFVIAYSRIDPIRHQFSGQAAQSRVDRPPITRRVLDPKRGGIEVVVLDGYLFFGSADRMASAISNHTERDQDLRHLIIDFQRVSGMDISAMSAITSAVVKLQNAGVQVRLSHASPDILHGLGESGELIEGAYPSLDLALESVENVLLEDSRHSDQHALREELDRAVGGGADLLLTKCMKIEVDQGEQLIRAGDPAMSLFLVEQGTLTAVAPGAARGVHRFRTVGPGSVLGEIAFTTGGVRTADVYADSAVVVYELTKEAWFALVSEHPQTALGFQQFLTQILADRMRSNSAAMIQLLN